MQLVKVSMKQQKIMSLKWELIYFVVKVKVKSFARQLRIIKTHTLCPVIRSTSSRCRSAQQECPGTADEAMDSYVHRLHQIEFMMRNMDRLKNVWLCRPVVKFSFPLGRKSQGFRYAGSRSGYCRKD